MITLPHAVYLYDSSGSAVTSDPTYGLRVKTNNDVDTFGAQVAHSRVSQMNADFSVPLANNDLTTTLSAGTVTLVSASAILSTGAGATNSAKINTNTVLSYSPGREAYAVFTAAFTSGVASSHQRIGLYDTTNGFFLGYNGTVFGITQRRATIDTFTSASAFVGDLLAAGAGSLFTRNNGPEAINYTLKNVFRIRFGWLGAAPIKFEVLSPDGAWVTFHTIKYPNTQVPPSILNAALPITAEVVKTAGASDIILNTTCWDGGVVESEGSDLSYYGSIYAASTLFTTTTRGKETVSFNVTGAFTGTMVVQAHNGDNLWQSVSGLTPAGVVVTSITSSNFFFINSAAYSQVRLSASALTAGTASIQSTATAGLTSLMITNLPAAQAKAVQSSLATPIQATKDTGRTSIILYATLATAGATTVETIISLSKSSGVSATSVATSSAITNGKRFRIENITVGARGHNTATAQQTIFNLRVNPSGAVTTTTTPIIMAARVATPATANAWDRAVFNLPDGYEILGTSLLQIGISAMAIFTTNAPTWDVTLFGYEY